jgi:hypothetical protein
MSFTEFSPSWGRTVAKMARAETVVLAEGSLLMAWAQRLGVQTAREQLDRLVYKAPLPPSAANDPHYLEHARTGRTRDAVKGEPISLGSFSSRIFVDRADYPAYYYAWVLEHGMQKHPAYYPRPFWSVTKRIMKIRLLIEAEKRLMRIKIAVR